MRRFGYKYAIQSTINRLACNSTPSVYLQFSDHLTDVLDLAVFRDSGAGGYSIQGGNAVP
jgi:hypothetical protein